MAEMNSSGFDSSDEENASTPVDKTPLDIDWVDLSDFDISAELGVSALPGCRFKDVWRSQKTDIDTIKSQDVTDVFVLVTKGEITKYRTYDLLDNYKEVGLNVHHHPFPDGQTPSIAEMLTLLEELKSALKQGKKSLVHCYGGLGRSSLVVACLLMLLNEELSSENAMDKVKTLRGSNAVQSIKQYNFINDFREKKLESQTPEDDTSRSVSR